MWYIVFYYYWSGGIHPPFNPTTDSVDMLFMYCKNRFWTINI